jgi:hypothetical protein
MGRNVGYGIAILINLVLLYVVQHLMEWGIAPFLTEEFNDLVPLITASLSVSVAVYVIYLFDDRPTIKSVGQIVTNLVSLFVTVQVFAVFPFDFTGYDFDWSTLVRVILILGMVGTVFGTLAEVRKLIAAEPGTERR